jgi:uncharacterized tellurite resistance protein B-like protein
MIFFQSKASKERMSAVMNAIVVMQADGKVTEEEKKMLMAICQRVGLTESEFKKIMNRPDKIKFTPPQSDKERVSQIYDAVWMMMVDGEIDEDEMQVCEQLAVMLGYRPAIVRDMVRKVASRMKGGVEEKKVKSEIESFLAG